MADPETITLPKSGVVMTRRGLVYVADGTDIRFRPDTRPYGSCPVAWCRNDAGHAIDCDDVGALAWLDDQVMKLRAALLPPGAIVVEDTQKTVDLVAAIEYRRDYGEEWHDATPALRESYLYVAAQMLAALRESRP